MTKRPSERNKTWEKDRRDRLNKAFEELAKLLPQYDPTVTWSKIEIIQKSIIYIEDLGKKHDQLLENHDPKLLDDYKDLLDTLTFFRARNYQLAELLNKAKITIPAAKFPKFMTEKAHILQEPIENSKPRQVGRPKKNLSVENGESNKKPITQDPPANKPDSTVVTTKTDAAPITTDERKIEDVAKSVPEVVPICTPVQLTATNPTATTVSVLQAGANAFIPTGVLIPVVTFKPAVIPPIIPPVSGSNLIPPAENVSSKSINTKSKCEILNIQTLPTLNKVPKKVVKGKDEKVNISPYPILKLYVRRSDNKVPIPALKREVVTVKKKRRNRKRGKAKECDSKNFKKRRKSVAQPISNVPRSKASNVDRTAQSFRQNIAYKKTDDLLNSYSKNSSKCIRLDSIESNDSTLKANNSLSLTDNELPDEYFSSLDIPDTNPNSASISPTAAFLLSFPVVNPSVGGKNVCNAEGEICENTQDRNDNNINEGLENLNNFFSTKEYYRYCNQTCEESGKLANGRGLLAHCGPQKSMKFERHFSDGKDAATMQMIAKSKTNSNLEAIGSAPLIEVNNKGKNMQKSFDGESNVPTIRGKNISSSIPYFNPLENSTLDGSLNPNMKLKECAMTSTSGIQGSRRLPVASNSGKPSNSFSVSNIFQNSSSGANSSHSQPNTTFTVAEIYSHTLPKAQTPVISFQPLSESTKTIGMYSDVEPPALGTIIPFFPKPASTVISKNTPNFSIINPIPTPISVPIPQPSNFSTMYIPPTSSSYIGVQNELSGPIISSSVWNESSGLITKSKSSFDVNAMLPQLSRSESTVQQSNLNFPFGNKNNVSSTKTTAQMIASSNFISTSITQHAVPFSSPPDIIAASSKSYCPSSTNSFSNQNDSKVLNQSAPIQQTMILTNPSKICSITDTNKSVANTGTDIANKNAYSSISKTKLNTTTTNPTSKKKSSAKSSITTTQIGKISTTPNVSISRAAPTASSKSSTKCLSISEKSYSLADTEFTFVLTGGTSTYVSTTAASGQSQPYFTYSNINQNLQWIPSTLNSDFQTPFTFSLTSTSSSSAATIQASIANPSNKPNVSIGDDKHKKSTQAPTSTNSFNSFPDLPISTSTYPVSSLAFAPQLPSNNSNYSFSEMVVPASNYCPTNFTFSLAKQQNTTTTVSSDFMKPLPSCNTIDQKYQPLYNTYGFDNYSQVYSSDATNFTFALTNPTQTSTTAKDVDNKNSQRFSGSFSIDATLGASVVYTTQASQCSTSSQAYPHKSEQSLLMQSKATPSTKVHAHQDDQMSSKVSSYFNSNQELQSKPTQKSHVNWMTSCNPGESINSNQQIPYYPSYSASTSDVNNKNNIFLSSSIDENFPAWSPSKVLDTSNLFQTPSSNNYYEFNQLPPVSSSVASKITQEPVKQNSKPTDLIEKDEKGYAKPSNKNSHSKFFSVSHLVDENTPNASIPTDNHAKKPKIKDVRKNLNSSFEADNPSTNSYETSKPTATTSSYSAEALISKKESRNQSGAASIHHLHNNDYYPTQNDVLNNSYFPQDTENINYNSNFFYNFIPPNQNFISDIDYLGSFPDTPSKKTDTSCNRKSLPVVSSSKDVDKKSQLSTAFNPNITLDSGFQVPSMPPPNVPPLDPFETFQYSNNFPNSGWNGNKIMGTNPQASLPFGDDPNMQVCNQTASGSSGSNITNFNLSTICPEISGKGNEPNPNNW